MGCVHCEDLVAYVGFSRDYAKHIGEIGLGEIPSHKVGGGFYEKVVSGAVNLHSLHVQAWIVGQVRGQYGRYGGGWNHGRHYSSDRYE